ncbi:DNA polymerase theta subunit, partial [Schistosoma japonicum]
MEIKVGSPIRIEDAFYVPEDLYRQYKEMNISSIFSWQAECLNLPGVLDGCRNLVYSAPTSAGKTLVAEIIVLKRILESTLKAFIILPYVSVSKEKMIYLQKLFNSLGIRVGGYMAGHSPPGGLSAINVAVCTIEKANSLVNRLIEEERLDELGIVVVDELHLIGDTHRGYLLELLLTKLLFYSRRKLNSKSIAESGISESSQGLYNESLNKCDCKTNSGIQIVGMSATLPNLKSLGQWLNAEVYATNFRPVPLTEFILSCDLRSKTNQFYKVVDSTIIDNNSTHPKSS